MHEFDTPRPVRIRLEMGAGDVTIEAVDTTATQVDVRPARDDDASREAAAATLVEHRGDDLIVKTPRRSTGFFKRGPQLVVRLVVPGGSTLNAEINSADLTTTGRLGSCDISTGSGDVTIETVDGDARLASGSGDLDVRSITGSSHIRAGSGDVHVEEATKPMTIGTGSGDVSLGRISPQLRAKSGSGDVQVGQADGEVALSSGSGDLQVRRITTGRVEAKTASGDVHVGIADGTAAWLDLNSLSGDVHTALEGSDEPGEGEQTVEIRATTVSGDVSVVRA